MGIHYVKDGRQCGPVERSELDQLVADGVIAPNGLVWEEGMDEWVSYIEYAEGSVRQGNIKMCALCRSRFSAADMVSFGATWVCAGCKPRYVQQLKEGVGVGHGQVWRFKRQMVKALDSPLPDCCARCGAPPTGKPLKRTAWWCPSWVYVLILINLIVVLIVYLVLRKRVDLEMPLCDLHRARRRNLLLACWGTALASIGGIVAAIASDHPEYIIIPILLMIVAAIAGSMISPVLTPAKVKDGYVWLNGVKRDYLQTLPEWDHRV